MESLGSDETRLIPKLLGSDKGFNRTSRWQSKHSCYPYTDQFHEHVGDDGTCGPTAPKLDATTTCCVGPRKGDTSSNMKFLEAIVTVRERIEHWSN